MKKATAVIAFFVFLLLLGCAHHNPKTYLICDPLPPNSIECMVIEDGLMKGGVILIYASPKFIPLNEP